MTRFCPKCQCETERKANSDCKPCAKVRAAIWAAKNSDRLKASSAAWRAANSEQLKAHRVENLEKINTEKRAWAAANKEKVQASNLNFRKANPEKIRAISMAYRKANHEKVITATKAWRAANQDKTKAYSLEYAAKNFEVRRIYEQNRNARKRTNGGTLSKGLASKLFKLQKGKCPCCKQLLGDTYHLDHIVPIAKGGSNTDDNIQLLRQRCNNQKSAKHPVDFMQSKGFLL